MTVRPDPLVQESFISTGGRVFWGAAGAGILPICTKTGRILVGFRKPPVQEPNTWAGFGGKIDEDESPEQGARRELYQETGYRGPIRLVRAHLYRHGSFSYHNFLGLLEDEFTPSPPDRHKWETKETRWVTYDELLALPKKHFGLEALIDNSKELIKKYATQGEA